MTVFTLKFEKHVLKKEANSSGRQAGTVDGPQPAPRPRHEDSCPLLPFPNVVVRCSPAPRELRVSVLWGLEMAVEVLQWTGVPGFQQ